MAKGLNLKVRKFWGLTPTFVEVTRKKLVGSVFLPPILNRVKDIGFKYEPYPCNNCHGLKQKTSFNSVAIFYVKGSADRSHFWFMSKNDAISIMNSSNLIYKMGFL